MNANTNTNASPAPTRVLRRHVQGSKARSNTGTFSQTVLSPVGSADYTQDNVTPDGSYLDSSPMSSPAAEPALDASHVAVIGSVPPSPILKARRLKQGSYFPTQSHKRWDEERISSEDQAKSIDAISEVERDEQVLIPRTANNARVIAVDLDLVYPRGKAQASSNEPIIGTQVQMMDEPEVALSPTEMKGATSGLLLALKHLRALGHPLHLVTSRPMLEKQEIEFWLAGQGFFLGTNDEDVFVALWFTDRIVTEVDAGGRSPATKAADAVLRGVNAALYITAAIDIPDRLTLTDVPIIKLEYKGSFSSSSSGDQNKAMRLAEVDEAQQLITKNRWADVVAWVKAWDNE